ncbi:MAG: ATP-grasp domain-containing protein [bacterium]|nr:ATP-grasp domain-containing protein [bacterium]
MIRVGVLRGGMSDEFEVSVKTGANVLSSLPSDKYKPVDILITRDGTWHVNGLPKTLEEIKVTVDVVFNALHGEYGEDGQVAQLLEEQKIPYTGSTAVPSALAMHKGMAKDAFRRAGLRTPAHMLLEDCRDSTIVGKIPEKIQELAFRVFKSIPPPWVLKPAKGGSSQHTYVATTFSGLVDGLARLFPLGNDLVVEQYIEGKEVSAGVVENFRRERKYPLMPVEVKKSGRYFDYASKQDPTLLCPSSLSRKEKEEVTELAEKAHDILGLRDYSISDFIVTPRGVYLLEVNNNPGITNGSIITKGLEAAGASVKELVDHLLTLALGRKR